MAVVVKSMAAWRVALAVAVGLMAGAAWSQEADRLALDVREAIVRVPARVEDARGQLVSGDLLVTTFRPRGPGPFPLVVISHGRDSKTRADYKRQRYESAARFFVRKGFAVAVPLRLGYGELAGHGDPESSVGCPNPQYAVALTAAARQILAVARFMAQQPDIDGQRIVLVGQSVGGMSTIAATAGQLPGQVAAINFAGGHGGNPETRPGDPCQPEQMRRLVSRFGELAGAAVPTLWLYAENDRYFGPRVARSWAQAYREAGGQAELQMLPPFGEDGHKLFTTGNDVWQPLVDEFLARHGFDRPGTIAVASGGNVPVEDENALPLPGALLHEGYRKFLAATGPRAFAINDQGRWGYAYGDDAPSRALAFCGSLQVLPCRLYAVNHTVVWSTP